MNEFKKGLKVEIGNREDIQVHSSIPYNQRLHSAILKAIEETKPITDKDRLTQVEYMMNINKYLENYEELRPVLTKYFEKDRWER